jgi:Protein of unknown function (DUF2911)
MKLNVFLSCVALALTASFSAQLTTPQPSPAATLKQKVGLTDVEINYSRPGAKGRVIFGDVVPFGTIWRTGANASTKIKVSDKVQIGGLEVPAGEYALYTIPGKDEWTIIIHTYLENWGDGGYDQTKDLGRFTVKPTQMMDKYETFTIDFSDLTTSTGNLNLIWENTKVSLPITTPADEMVEKQIEKVMAGPSANDYYQSARFYLEKEKNLDQALTYINLAVEKRPEAFWYTHVQAKILAKLGKKKEALAAAEKSLELAKASKDGDFGYIANNEKLIKEIKAMK